MAKILTKTVTFPYLRIEAAYDSVRDKRVSSTVDGGPGFIYLIMGRTILFEDSIHMLTHMIHKADQVLKELAALRVDGITTKVDLSIPEHIHPVILWPR